MPKKAKMKGLGVPANLIKDFIDLSYKGDTSISPEGYKIDTDLSDSRVKVYTKPNSKEVIVVHRGSVGADDWIDNAKYFAFGSVKNTKTFKLHKERQLKAIEKYGANNIIGIGHSRAGLYLEALQKEYPIKEIITYNKAVGFYDALRANPAEQTDIKVKNDFVSLLSGLQKRPNKMVEIEATSNLLDLNKAHQAKEIDKLGTQFIGLKEDEKVGSGRKIILNIPMPKTSFIGSGALTKEELGKLSKKDLFKLNKQYSKDFKNQFKKPKGLRGRPRKNTKKGGGLDTLGNMIWSGFANVGEEWRIEQEARKVLDGVKVWHLPFWKPADHITEREAQERVEARRRELGVEALRDKISNEVGFDIRTMNNNKALGIATSGALDALSYTPLGIGTAALSSATSQLIDRTMAQSQEAEENRLAQQREAQEALEAPEEEDDLRGGGTAPKPKTLEELKKKLKALEKKLDKINKGKVYKTTNKDKVKYEISYIEARIINYETKGEDLIITKKKKYGDELPKKAKPYKPKPKKEPKAPEPKKEENKLDFLKLGTNYTKMDFSKAVNNYIRTNNLQSKTNEREFRIDKNLSKLFNIEENKLITYFQAGTLFKPTINELFKDEPKPEPPKAPEPKPEPPKVPEPKKEEPKPKKEPNPWSQSGICKKIMCAYGLRNKAQYKAWIVKNHPDKGGKISKEDLIKIIECANEKLYCKGKKPVIEEPKAPDPLLITYKEEEIELPEPEPTKKPIEPLINKLEKKIEEFEKVGREHGAVIYDATTFIQIVAYIALLMEYEAKCAILGDKEADNIRINSKLRSPMNKEFYEKAEELSGDLLDCIEREDKLIAIPLSLRFGSKKDGHANLLIYRPFEKTIERFEPHGNEFQGSEGQDADKVFNSVLTRMFEVEMKPYLKEYTPKFISPDQVCPNPKGFQVLEGQVQSLKQEGGGFCGMWSLFILELLFINPTKPTAEIIKEALAISKEDPQYLRNVIRGYVKKTERLLNDYVKKIDANDGFTFAKGKDLYYNKKIAFQEKLLELLLSFGGKSSQVKKIQKEITTRKEKENKYKDLIDLLETKSLNEINDMMGDVFNSNGFSNKWRIADIIKNIIRKVEGVGRPDDMQEEYKKKVIDYFDVSQY